MRFWGVWVALRRWWLFDVRVASCMIRRRRGDGLWDDGFDYDDGGWLAVLFSRAGSSLAVDGWASWRSGAGPLL